jgi:hypothetical protein
MITCQLQGCLLRPKNKGSLTFQQIKDCKDGPQGEKAIGVTVAKTFDGVEFKGLVDSFRTERKRHIYHVTYTDGDEEELSQKELRDAFVLGLAPAIEVEWKKFNGKGKDKVDEDNEGDTSSGEGSVYDKSSEEEEMRKIAKRRRRNNSKQPLEKTKKRAKLMDLSGLILPKSGDKTVAGEAFEKLSSSQKKVVAENVNKKTK